MSGPGGTLTTWQDYLGNLDINAIYDLGNQWIRMGDSLYSEQETLDDKVASLGWNGEAGTAAWDTWANNIAKVMFNAADTAWKVGEAINAYADGIKDQAQKMAKQDNAQTLATIFGFILGAFTAIFSELASLIPLLARIIGSLVNVMSAIATRVGTLGASLFGFTAGAATGAAASLGFDMVAMGLGDLAAHNPFHVDWKSEAGNMGLGAALGGIFGAVGTADAAKPQPGPDAPFATGTPGGPPTPKGGSPRDSALPGAAPGARPGAVTPKGSTFAPTGEPNGRPAGGDPGKPEVVGAAPVVTGEGLPHSGTGEPRPNSAQGERPNGVTGEAPAPAATPKPAPAPPAGAQGVGNGPRGDATNPRPPAAEPRADAEAMGDGPSARANPPLSEGTAAAPGGGPRGDGANTKPPPAENAKPNAAVGAPPPNERTPPAAQPTPGRETPVPDTGSGARPGPDTTPPTSSGPTAARPEGRPAEGPSQRVGAPAAADPRPVATPQQGTPDTPRPQPEVPKPDPGGAVTPAPGTPNPEAVRPAAPRPEPGGAAAPAPDAVRPEAPKPDPGGAAAPTPDAVRPGAARPDPGGAEPPKADAPLAGAPAPDAVRPGAARPEPGRAEPPKPEAPRPETTARPEVSRSGPGRAEPPKPEPGRPENVRADPGDGTVAPVGAAPTAQGGGEPRTLVPSGEGQSSPVPGPEPGRTNTGPQPGAQTPGRPHQDTGARPGAAEPSGGKEPAPPSGAAKPPANGHPATPGAKTAEPSPASSAGGPRPGDVSRSPETKAYADAAEARLKDSGSAPADVPLKPAAGPPKARSGSETPTTGVSSAEAKPRPGDVSRTLETKTYADAAEARMKESGSTPEGPSPKPAAESPKAHPETDPPVSQGNGSEEPRTGVSSSESKPPETKPAPAKPDDPKATDEPPANHPADTPAATGPAEPRTKEPTDPKPEAAEPVRPQRTVPGDVPPAGETRQVFRTDERTGDSELVELATRGGRRLGGPPAGEPPPSLRPAPDRAGAGEPAAADHYSYHEVDPGTGVRTETHVGPDEVVVSAKPAGGEVPTQSSAFKGGKRIPVGEPQRRLPVYDHGKGRWDVETVGVRPDAPHEAPPGRPPASSEGKPESYQVLRKDGDGNVDLLTFEGRPADVPGPKGGGNDGYKYHSLDGGDPQGWHDGNPFGTPKTVDRVSSAPGGSRLDGKPVENTEPPAILVRDQHTGLYEKVTPVSSGGRPETGGKPAPGGRSYFQFGSDGDLRPVGVRSEKIQVIGVSPGGKVARTNFSPSGEGSPTLVIGRNGILTPSSRPKISASDLRYDKDTGRLTFEEPDSAGPGGGGGPGHDPGTSGGGAGGTETRPKGGGSQTQTQTQTTTRTFTDDSVTDAAKPSPRSPEGDGPEQPGKKGPPEGEGADDAPAQASPPKEQPAGSAGSGTSPAGSTGTRTRGDGGSRTVTETPRPVRTELSEGGTRNSGEGPPTPGETASPAAGARGSGEAVPAPKQTSRPSGGERPSAGSQDGAAPRGGQKKPAERVDPLGEADRVIDQATRLGGTHEVPSNTNYVSIRSQIARTIRTDGLEAGRAKAHELLQPRPPRPAPKPAAKNDSSNSITQADQVIDKATRLDGTHQPPSNTNYISVRNQIARTIRTDGLEAGRAKAHELLQPRPAHAAPKPAARNGRPDPLTQADQVIDKATGLGGTRRPPSNTDYVSVRNEIARTIRSDGLEAGGAKAQELLQPRPPRPAPKPAPKEEHPDPIAQADRVIDQATRLDGTHQPPSNTDYVSVRNEIARTIRTDGLKAAQAKAHELLQPRPSRPAPKPAAKEGHSDPLTQADQVIDRATGPEGTRRPPSNTDYVSVRNEIARTIRTDGLKAARAKAHELLQPRPSRPAPKPAAKEGHSDPLTQADQVIDRATGPEG
ncbi:hypothetical protein QWU11_20300, partial [Actinomadura sp. DC4]|nr:hypothetical protein [Actinomadura sp. DC4]